ncbi:MAG: hypothetical protein RLZZ237_182 [Pseudomonadota bacterium]
MMKKIVAILFAALSLALFAAVPALAQNAQAPAARQAEPSPAMKVAVRDMLEAIQFPALTRQIFDQMLQSVPAMMRQAAVQNVTGNADVKEKRQQQALANVEEEIPLAVTTLTEVLNDPTLTEELRAEMVQLYARYYTVQEIEQLTAFYKTPLGRKLLATMPKLSVESVEISQRVLIPRVNAVLEKIKRASTEKPE